MNQKGNASNLVGGAIAVIVLIVLTVIVGTVEDGTVWVNSLSTTIGNYVEPLMLLGAFVVAGYMGYKAISG